MLSSASDRLAPADSGTAPGAKNPTVTVAIVTRDRKDELRAAVQSAVEQHGNLEILVLDDGSRDGTLEMLRDEFPTVRVVRFDDNADVAARRNAGAELARGDVIVSIDDDAVFTTPHIVADTLRDLDDPRIGAVAIPYVDVGIRPEVQQLAPEPNERWVTTIFRATAYAIRRDVLVDIGGYTPEILQFGEEWDLSLKMLNAGYVIRLGRSDPIHHYASPKRDYRRMDVYYRRNELLICWMYFPFPWSLLYMVGYAVKGLQYGVKVGRRWHMVVGVAEGVRACLTLRDRRRPISRAAFRLDQRSRARARANGALRLAEAEAELGLLGPAAKPLGGGWPDPLWRLHGPLRRARTRVMQVVGRPVECEVCGEVLFRGLPFVWRGRVKLLGAESALVRVDWDKMNRMTFRHVEMDRCRPR
jgi:glycosyltransferase involved in cell wall biosynthesis